MLLKEVKIKNFKSIQECDIDTAKGCKVFVGLSESGKSNLLYALSALDSEFKLSKEYVKEGTRSTQEASIRYVLSMTKEESSNFYEIIKQNIYSSKQDRFIQLDEKNIKLVDFLKFEYVYFVDIRTNERTMRYYLLGEKANYSISENHKFILGTKEKPLVITNKKSEEQYEIKEKIIVNIDEYDIGENQCEEITAERLNGFFCGFGTEIAKKDIPNVLF